MKRVAAFCAMLCLMLWIAPGAFAAPVGGVYDPGDLLRGNTSALDRQTKDAAARTGFSFIILLMNNPIPGELEIYCEEYYRSIVPGNVSEQPGVMLTVNLYDRDVYVSSYDDALDYLSPRRLDAIREEITPFLSAGRYDEACAHFITLSERNSTQRQSWIQSRMETFSTTSFSLICVIVLAISMAILWFLTTRGIHTSPPPTAVYSHNVKIQRQSDIFLRTRTTKIPKSNNNGGGSRSGGGGGGRSGGSRGKF